MMQYTNTDETQSFIHIKPTIIINKSNNEINVSFIELETLNDHIETQVINNKEKHIPIANENLKFGLLK